MDEKSGFAEQMPQTIGRYQIHESIGFGAMGAVYKAFDPLIKRTLAIKTIRLDIPRNSPQYKSFIERFYHEARISGTLSHPNIVTLFDIGEEGGIPYLAMEFVEGQTIASLIEKGVRFPPEKVIGLISQIASAVDYAHSKGVIHRDIKPSNLILYEGDRVKVTDFGIAKLVDAEMTQSGTLLGTPSYMSPEQAMGDKLDGRSDIFSLGVCAFEMLAGEQPFPGNNVTSILYKLVHVDPIEPANLEMHGLVPQKWHEVFGKVLAKKPDDRYQTATEFVQDLEYCLGAWFGSIGEETLSEGSPANAVAAAATTAAPPAATPAAPPPAAPRAEQVAVDEATRALPAVPAAPAAPAPPPAAAKSVAAASPPPSPPAPARPAPPPPAAAKPPESPVTVQMPAPSEAPATVVMNVEELPPARPPKPKADKGAVKPSTAEKTVLMSADQLPARAAPKAKAAPSNLTVPPGTPLPTVKAPAMAPAATTKMPAPPPTVKERVPEATVTGRASASDMTARAPAAEVTTRAPSPPPPRAPAAPAPARQGLPVGLVVGSAALFFVVALGVAGFVLFGKSRSAEEPQPTTAPPPLAVAPTLEASAVPPAPDGVLHVESQPPGASVTVNGEARGVTPLDVTGLPAGLYDIKLELKGYAPQSQSVALAAGAMRSDIKLALARPQPVQGLADIVSTPFGAAVTIDGAPAGQTPLTNVKLRPGSHRVQMSKEGYEPWAGDLVVEVSRRARLDAPLKAIAVATPPPTPRADVVDPSRVYVTSEVDTPPKKLSGSVPYPENAPKLRSGESVSVSVSFVVTENGEVTDLKIVESGGKILDEAVMGSMQRWKYAPGVKLGTKVKVRLTVKQTFRAG